MTYYAIGIFNESAAARDAVDALRKAGVSDDALTMLASADAAEVSDIVGLEPAESALEGALKGTGIGGALGALGAIGIVALPGVGALLASGLIATLSGGVLGGYLGALYSTRAETNEVIEIKNHLTPDSIILVVQGVDESQAQSYCNIMKERGSPWAETLADEAA